jgi:parallel beta-helix repeat protein
MVGTGGIHMRTNSQLKLCLAVGIILLFIGTAIIPSSGQIIKKTSSPINGGNTLYVGGTGPGNYTRIQDAIDNATNGDTIVVSDVSSPYYENLVIKKSITVLGTGGSPPIIDGGGHDDVVFISADDVHLEWFTLQYSGPGYFGDCGVEVVAANGVTIMNTTVTRNTEGIFLQRSNHSMITGNRFSQDNDTSIITQICNDTDISNNVIQSGGLSILLEQSTYTNISKNFIAHNTAGISLDASDHNTIYQNIIRANGNSGIQMAGTDNAVISNTLQANYFIEQKSPRGHRTWMFTKTRLMGAQTDCISGASTLTVSASHQTRSPITNTGSSYLTLRS